METDIINAARFSDNGNGTVTDNNSGLVWCKNTTPDRHKRTWVLAFNPKNYVNPRRFGLRKLPGRKIAVGYFTKVIFVAGI